MHAMPFSQQTHEEQFVNKLQKIAIGEVVISLITLLIVAVLAFLVGQDLGRLGFLALLLLVGLAGIFRVPKGQVAIDERDELIALRASRIGFISGFVFLCIGSACVGIWYEGAQSDIPNYVAFWGATIGVPVVHLIKGSTKLYLYQGSPLAA
jgi:hypothetical protein